MNNQLFILTLVLCVLGCSSPGVLYKSHQIPSAPVSNIQLQGYAGIGKLAHADIDAYNYNELDGPTLLASTKTDEKGYFSLELDSTALSLVLLTATKGKYIEPISSQIINQDRYTMKALYNLEGVTSEDEIIAYITPTSTLFSSLYECLARQETFVQDPFLYAVNVFEDVFLINPIFNEDLYLNEQASQDEDNALYTLYNLAFAQLAFQKRAQSSQHLLSLFADQFSQSCSLLFHNEKHSAEYVLPYDAFRTDYLNNFLVLSSQARFQTYFEKIPLDEVVFHIRSITHMIFGFNNYEY